MILMLINCIIEQISWFQNFRANQIVWAFSYFCELRRCVVPYTAINSGDIRAIVFSKPTAVHINVQRDKAAAFRGGFYTLNRDKKSLPIILYRSVL